MFKEWLKEIVWLKDKVILPNGTRISKDGYYTPNGFDSVNFEKKLKKVYEKFGNLK